MRVIIYARYSSDQQRAASIADQFRSCREYAAARGWTVIEEMSDAAMSGSTMFRPGVQALLRAVKDGRCDLVLCEGVDRLSRDLADTAALFKQLRYARVTLHTLLEGVVSSMHVGLKGTMNEMYLAELGVRTHRGQKGNVLQGKVAGGNSYGYRTIPGRLGERDIDQAQAAIVRRIFTEYVDGVSPKRIARALNREGVAGPRGGAWSPSTLHGQPRRGTGILNNELYVGRLVWDRLKWMTHPDTGRRLCRLKPREEWVSIDVPHLRILPDDLWQAAKDRQAGARMARSWNDQRRPRHLFSGLTKCATCSGGFTIFNHDNLFCFNARERGTCSNLRRIKRPELEARVLTAMRERLMNPAAYAEFREGFNEEMAQLRRLHVEHRSSHQQELQRVDRRIREIVAAVSDGFRSDALREELSTLESRKAVLVAEVQPPASVTLPSANLAQVFRATVAALTERLSEGAAGEGVGQRLRSFIDRIVIPPDGLLRVVGNPAAMFGLDPGGMVGCGGVHPTIPPGVYEAAA